MTFIPSLLKRIYAGGFVLKVFKYSRVYRQNLMLDQTWCNPKVTTKKIWKQSEGWPSVFQTGPGIGSMDTNHSTLLGTLFASPVAIIFISWCQQQRK